MTGSNVATIDFARFFRSDLGRAENSHVPIRRRERKMQGFRSAGSTQRFLAIHAAVANTFTTCRHLISAKTHRLFRDEAFAAWQQAAKLAA